MKKSLIYIIYGGPSSEREVSFSSKDYFYDLYKDKKPILVEWLKNFKFKENSKTYEEEAYYQKLSKENCIAIIAGHGEYIEDGYLQEKLALNKIKFTGSDSRACSLAMDKFETQLLASKFVKTIPTYKSKPKDFDFKLLNKYVGKSPIFVKPNALGSSVGCFVISNKNDLDKILPKIDNTDYLFQKVIKGIELSVGSVREGVGFLNLPPTEIRPVLGDFFTWDAKYKTGGSSELTPATINIKIQDKIKYIANKVHNKLGLGYYSRSDFIYTDREELYYLETNTLPGMSKTSLLPQQLAYSKNIDKFKVGILKNLV